jgi:hypothetical protein
MIIKEELSHFDVEIFGLLVPKSLHDLVELISADFPTLYLLYYDTKQDIV